MDWQQHGVELNVIHCEHLLVLHISVINELQTCSEISTIITNPNKKPFENNLTLKHSLSKRLFLPVPLSSFDLHIIVNNFKTNN